MRRRLMLFWILLTLAVFGAILLLMSVTGLFSNADRSLQQGLQLQLDSTSKSLQGYLDQLTAQSLSLSEAAGREVESLLLTEGITFEELNDSPERLLKVQQALYAPVNTTLHMSKCSGAYAILDATANTAVPDAQFSRSGLYLRCVNISGSTLVDPDINCFRGIPDVPRQRRMELHNRWNLEFDVQRIPGYQDLIAQQISRPAEHYYWTERLPLEDTWEEVLLLCVPLVGDNHTVYGVCGVEISELFFQLAFPVRQTEFGPVITVLAPLEDGKIMLEKGLTGGVSGTYLEQAGNLTIHHGGAYNNYTGEKGGYVGVQQLVNISQEDDEYRQWVVALLLPDASYSAYAAGSYQELVLKCIAILAVLIVISALLYLGFVRPFRKGGPDAGVQPSAGEDLRGLIGFVRACPTAGSFDPGELPPEIRQIMRRFALRTALLEGEPRRVFRLLAAGSAPDELQVKTGLGRRAVRRSLAELCRVLEVDSVDDILLYIDFFRRCGRLEQLTNL